MQDLSVMSELIPMRLQVAENFAPMSFVPSATERVHKQFDGLCSVDVIHSGYCVPPDFYNRFKGDEAGLIEAYNTERDWGADFVAQALTAQLGLSGYYRVNTARVFVEVGRFPQRLYRRPSLTPLDQPFNRIAFTEPYSARLNDEEREAALSAYYDPACDVLEQLVATKRVKIAIHTYDATNQSGTPRPEVSLIHIPKDYQDNSCLPEGAFDPLFPHALAESTASPKLVYLLALTLQKGGVHAFTNLPYTLPAGSIEVRANVWHYMQHLRQQYEHSYPDYQQSEPHQQIWQMLSNTNARRVTTRQLRAQLQRANGTDSTLHQAYKHIQQFTEEQGETRVNTYKYAPNRPDFLAIEVRKDLLFKQYHTRFGQLTRADVNWETINHIANLLADGLQIYLNNL